MTSYQPILLTQPAASLPPSMHHRSIHQVIPGYGGGMSSAKAQLESDTRVLAYEAGRKYKVGGGLGRASIHLFPSCINIYRPTDRLNNTTRHITTSQQVRVNTISAGPLKSRAASAIGGGGGKKTFIECVHYALHCVSVLTRVPVTPSLPSTLN